MGRRNWQADSSGTQTAGLTQQELADRANVSRSAIKALESGAGSTLSTFIGVVRALDLDETLDQIFATASTISPLAMIKEAKRSRVR